MSTRILLAKHIADYRRNEPRNVGVIVASEHGYAARFVGEAEPGRVDGNRARSVVGPLTDVYREWVAFWREELHLGAHGLQAVLDERAPNFYLEAAADMWEEDSQAPQALLDYYYDVLVGDPPKEEDRNLTLRQQVEQLIDRSGVGRLPGYTTNRQLTATVGSRALPLRFPYARENGHLVIGDYLAANNTRRSTSLLFNFEHAPQEVARMVVFYATSQGEDEASAQYLGILEDLGSFIIDVESPTAEEDTTTAFR